MARTVYLLGAGASAGSHFGLPVMTRFFADRDRVPTALDSFLRQYFWGVPREEWNLEDVMSFLLLSTERGPRWAGEVPSHHQHYDVLLQFIHERLATEGTCVQHDRLVRSLSRDDTILSLNYDCIADNSIEALERSSSPVADPGELWNRRMRTLDGLLDTLDLVGGEPMTWRPEETGFYIKLHGSLDWLCCPDDRCRNHSRFVRPSEVHSALPGDPCRLCGSSLRTVIIPPGLLKAAGSTGRMSSLWNLAHRELRRATRCVVVGVSMAAGDIELRWLLRSSAWGRSAPIDLVVVNPDSAATQRAEQLFGVRAQRTYRGLDEFVDGVEDRR